MEQQNVANSPNAKPGTSSSNYLSIPYKFGQQFNKGVYKPPLGQFLFTKYRRAIDTFGPNSDYYDEETYKFQPRFGSEDFKVRDIYDHYSFNTSRYPIQAFLDIYLFDSLQEREIARTFEEKQKLMLKTKKFSQLAQKLYQLKNLEEALTFRIKMLKLDKE